MNYRKQRTIETQNHLTAIALTPDGKRVFFNNLDDDGNDRIGLLELSTGKSVSPSPKFECSGIWSLAMSPDGRFLAVGAGWEGSLSIWDAKDMKELRMIAAHKGRTGALTFSSDGKTIVSGCQDGLVRLWDTETGKLLHSLKGHTKDVRSVAIRPDGKQVASGSNDGTVRLWDITGIKK